MIFIHKFEKKIFGYHDKTYNYFYEGKYTINKLSREYSWSRFVREGSLKQLAPSNLWRW